MKDGATQGFIQAYNTQIAVDGEARIVVATELNNQANDRHQLLPMIEAVKEKRAPIPRRPLPMPAIKARATLKRWRLIPRRPTWPADEKPTTPASNVPQGRIPKDATHTKRMDKTSDGIPASEFARPRPCPCGMEPRVRGA